MKTVVPRNVKVVVPFKVGELPQIHPDEPAFELVVCGLRILVSITAKSARKLNAHLGSAVLQGRLVADGGRLVLLDAGFQLVPVPAPEPVGGVP